MSLPHEINHQVLAGIRKSVGAILGKSHTGMDKWCMTPKVDDGEGIASPTHRFLELALAVGSVDRARLVILLDYVLGECGFAPAIPMGESAEAACLSDVARAAHHVSEWLATLVDAHSDGVLTTSELHSVEDVLQRLAVVILPALHAVRRAEAQADLVIVRRRLGAKRAPARIHLLRGAASA